MSFTNLKAIIDAEDWEEVEYARGPGIAPHVDALIAWYD